MNADPTVLAKLAAYESMDVRALVAEYQRLYGVPPRSKHRVWLKRNVCWRIQERAHGGLSPSARERLETLIDETVVPGCGPESATQPARPRDPTEPPVGVVLERDWRGERVRVTVRADGYEHEGRMFKSLSAVARHLTGTRWNGRAFFNVAPSRSRR